MSEPGILCRPPCTRPSPRPGPRRPRRSNRTAPCGVEQPAGPLIVQTAGPLCWVCLRVDSSMSDSRVQLQLQCPPGLLFLFVTADSFHFEVIRILAIRFSRLCLFNIILGQIILCEANLIVPFTITFCIRLAHGVSQFFF